MLIFRTLAVLAVIGLALTAATQAHAQGKDASEKRQAKQERAIKKGERSGALTQKEAARLEKGQDRVDKMQSKARADGKVTKKERARLDKAQDREAARIQRERTDKQTSR
jgi:hypothetical protein